MRIRPDQVAAHLRKTLAPLYLVFGEEPLQIQETAAALRAAARERGCDERECLAVETGFDWATLRQRAASRSLFAGRRLLELRLGNAKPGDAGAKALAEYAARPADDAVLLITAGKLDWQTQKSHWFTALDGAGVIVQAAPVEPGQWPGWIERRLRGRGLNPAPDAVALLGERVEGNLLAAAQEIEKLALLVDGPALTVEAVLAAVGDSARYSIYDFVDAALLGKPERVARMLEGLRDEGVEPVLVNWALHQEVRRLVALAFARDHGQALEAALAGQKVWDKRKPLLRQALQRLGWDDCRNLLRACAHTDCLIKGAEVGSPWDALLENGLRLAGVELLATDG
ncbi:MAG: DNA polymerase III subunit delta [Candidatus Contendobacter sp.]|nr:DNA polymerase III subunit delta [Candidatus Contendobacter sp.]MDG4559138.1 DNA polymerase III subunit delta [Candidatus Contendobacter sp.]